MSSTPKAVYQYRIKLKEENFKTPFYVVQRLDGVIELAKFLNKYLKMNKEKTVVGVEVINNSYYHIENVHFLPIEIKYQRFMESNELRLQMYFYSTKNSNLKEVKV